MSKARNLSAFISDPAIDASEIGSNAVTTDKLSDLSVTHAKLHTNMDLTSKTVTFADNHISGNKIHGGVIRALMANCLSMSIVDMNRFEVPYACFSRIQVTYDKNSRQYFYRLIAHNLAAVDSLI